MRLTTKDSVGLVLVMGTLATLVFHNSARHLRTHLPMVADAGGAITSASETSTTAFVDFNILPMDGTGPKKNQVVIVRDGFIDRIGPRGVIEVPEDARIVEGHGLSFLVPGLVDAHVHLPDARVDVLPLFLANGVTSVFNLEGNQRHLALRARSREPDFVGPTVYTSGPFVNDDEIASHGGARRVVEEQASAGYDFIKVHGTISEQNYAELTAAAHDLGIPVVGHAPRSLPFTATIEHGQVSLSHAEELIYTGLASLDESRLDDVAERLAQAGMWVTPTASSFRSISEQWASPEGLVARLQRPDVRYLPLDLRNQWARSGVYSGRPRSERDRIVAMQAFHAPLIRALYAAGVPLLAGTDTPISGVVPGFSLHDELGELLADGLPVDVVLTAATSNAGRFIRENVDPTAQFGRVAVGNRADLVSVATDPRADLDALRAPLGVMVRGHWYARAQLEAWLAQAAGERVAQAVAR